ncbi:MarR family winged helix-turn-helix transcriptional regulator [Maritalea myrionectae]|uniref:MarR family winged helix-turn-helix transcriptional regulator n=1 Tax=Maritalea myrionectae TaxID=454601 RepID=UPI000684A32E|nr:MarR family transcriptional regulator [Maritalea myrionectae]
MLPDYISSESPKSPKPTELERLQAEGIRAFRTDRPRNPPLIFSIKPIVAWIETRLIELLREVFPEARAAFNPVFIHLPADGCRLTELAAKADMTKQAMSEIVEELIDLGYLARFPDPSDKRAKIILRTDAGLELHQHALTAFSRIETELAEMFGPPTMGNLRKAAMEGAAAIQKPT